MSPRVLLALHRSLVVDWKVDRSRDKAELVRFGMQRGNIGGAGRIRYLHARVQGNFREFAGSVRVLPHFAQGLVSVRSDHNAGVGTEMQKPKHVTSRE